MLSRAGRMSAWESESKARHPRRPAARRVSGESGTVSRKDVLRRPIPNYLDIRRKIGFATSNNHSDSFLFEVIRD